ncbi:MAG: ABC transporter ATP-binding protein [Erysipelotrichaceae bacterium]|nr:ABC transporter ATP-binding protein [Erysipelotrichaceae bacterium]
MKYKKNWRLIMSNTKVIFRMLKLVKPLSLQMVFAIITGVLGFICAIGIPVVSTMVLLQVLGMYTHVKLNYLLILLLTFAILRGVLHYLEQQANHYIAFKLLAIIRDKVYTTLRRLAPAKLDGKDKGNLIALITNDVELLEVFYAHTISPTIIALFTSLILLILFAHMNIIAMLIALVAYITMGIIIPFTVNKIGEKSGQKSRDAMGDFSSFLLESYRSIDTIIQYNIGDKRLSHLLNQSDAIEQTQKKLKDIESFQMILSQLLISTSAILMFIVMFYLQQKGEVNTYVVILSTVLMLSSFGPVLALSNLANNLLITLSSAKRVITLLDEKEIITEVTGLDQVEFNDIDIKNINFKYDNEDILEDLSVLFKKDTISAIIGKSGSGKSTLLKLIMRFYDPYSGSININNKDIKQINTTNLRNMFAYVTQDTMLFHDSIYNNLKIAKLDASKEEIIDACKKANIHDFIMSLEDGYDTKVAELGASLSGGERQRIGLARAFLSDADCILLDEPTSNLDVLNEAIILKSIKENPNKTVILVSHRESTVKIANSILKMETGRLS